MTDWRAALLVGVELPSAVDKAGETVAVRWGQGRVAGAEVVTAVWDFHVRGGSLGVSEASAFCAAAQLAAASGRPLLTFLRSGGTRLQQGAAALAGLARTTLAVRQLAAAGVAHIAIVDHPTTGGAWLTLGARADLRLGVAGSVVGFGGPRVVAAVTGSPVPPDSHTAEAAAVAGLLDAVRAPEQVEAWLAAALAALATTTEEHAPEPAGQLLPTESVGRSPSTIADERSGWDQVLVARDPDRADSGQWARQLLGGSVALAALDPAVPSWVGRLAGHAAVVVALGTGAQRRPDPAGFRQLTRAAQLADRLGLALVTVVDTPGAEPGPAAERDGVAPAIGEAMEAVLSCRPPTLAVLLGEGGSGGALAALVCDRVVVGRDGYLAALAPEGVAVTLRDTTPEQAAHLLALRPRDLLALGIADSLLSADLAGDPQQVLAALWQQREAARLADRQARWAAPLDPAAIQLG